MTRVVVQRTLNNSTNSSQGRQSSSAPQSTTTSAPSSANSSSSSHPLTHSSSLALSVPPCPDDGGVRGAQEWAEQVSHPGDDNVNLNSELHCRLAASAVAVEGKSSERQIVHGDPILASEDGSLSCRTDDTWEGRREVALLTPLDTSGECLEIGVGGDGVGQELGKGKELAEEGRFLKFGQEDDRNGGSTSEDSAVANARGADDSSSERSHADDSNVLQGVQIRVPAPQTLSSFPVQAVFSAAASPLFDTASVHGPDQGRPNSSQSPPEAVGCSYLSMTVSSAPLSSSSSSRRGSWLGSFGSAGPPSRGGLSRRGSRVCKPSRNSPNSSRPSSPRAYGEGDGYNSADEHNSRSSGSTAYDNNEEREHHFELEIRCKKNLEVRRMAGDGNCLFRAVADQVYGDAEMYDETRQMCIDYMEKERDHFSQFVTESFTAYCKRKRRDKVYGNNLEIQAMAEMYNRPIHIYSYSTEPINIFHGSYETDLPPIRLSYHRGNHYNSLVDPGRPAVGAGLGFGSLRGTNVDRDQVKAALKAQQDQQIDKALLAEGRFYSDIELTEQEMQRMVMEASRAEFFEEEKHRHYAPGSEATSTSAAAEPSSSGTTGSPKSAARTMNLAATSPASADSAGLTANVRMLMSMGFSYLQVMEACSIFGDDVNNMLCYLLETENGTSGDGESMYRKKGKAAER